MELRFSGPSVGIEDAEKPENQLESATLRHDAQAVGLYLGSDPEFS